MITVRVFDEGLTNPVEDNFKKVSAKGMLFSPNHLFLLAVSRKKL